MAISDVAPCGAMLRGHAICQRGKLDWSSGSGHANVQANYPVTDLLEAQSARSRDLLCLLRFADVLDALLESNPPQGDFALPPATEVKRSQPPPQPRPELVDWIEVWLA